MVLKNRLEREKNPETGEYEYSTSFRFKYIDDGPFNPTTMLKTFAMF